MTNMNEPVGGPIEYTIDPKTKQRVLRWRSIDMTTDGAIDFRDGLIQLRDSALKEGNPEWAVYLSHMIVGWDMMAKWVFGVEYDRALAKFTAKAKAAAASDTRNDTEGGAETQDTSVQADPAGHGAASSGSADQD